MFINKINGANKAQGSTLKAQSFQHSALSFQLSILLSILISAIFFHPANAESFKITVSGAELKNLTALELKLDINPVGAFVLDEKMLVFDLIKNKETGELERTAAKERVLYKFVDTVHNSIRVFFYYPLNTKSIELEGNIQRSNFSGVPELKINEVNYISDFSLNINPKKLETKIEITSKEEALPYKGISKAEILGPHERIFIPNMFITIGNLETYGFAINAQINHFKINGQEARLIDENIIAARLNLDPNEVLESLPIILEIEVDNQTVRKEVGTIEFFENLN